VIIPNAEQAIIDIRKLHDYCLNVQHRVGRHKARLFAALLDMHQEDAEALHAILLQTVCTHDAIEGEKDEHGQRYLLDFQLNWQERQALVRSIWNIRPSEETPRLVTCYPIKETGS